jgi:hypothetical protein
MEFSYHECIVDLHIALVDVSVVLLDVCVPLLREFLLQHQVVLLQAQVVALSLAAEMLIVCQSLLDVHSLLIASDWVSFALHGYLLAKALIRRHQPSVREVFLGLVEHGALIFAKLPFVAVSKR